MWYRNVPQKGHVNPNRPKLKSGPDTCYKTLTGQRRTTARITMDNGDVVERVLEDFWDIPIEHFVTNDPYDEESFELIKNRHWTGMVEFKKSALGDEVVGPSGQGEVTTSTVDRRPLVAAARRRYNRKADSGEMVLETDVIDDGMINPCTHAVDDAEAYGDLYHQIETQRSRLEELAIFEREVDLRVRKDHQELQRGTSCAAADEAACLAALSEVHGAPPRLLRDTDFSEHDNFTMRSKLGHHRERIRPAPILPYDVLVARSVPRNELLQNKEAMKAYWKEWENLENKQVWRWETLVEREEVVRCS